MVKRVGKYEIGRTLGEGTFGKVKFAVNTETNERVAIKILDKEKIQKHKMGEQIKKEISIMKMMRHRHIVQLKEVLASSTKIFIVVELVTGGELFDKIVAAGRLDESTARYYFQQLIDGMSYCHAEGVVHRDLKPENLLLDKDGILKISDFGLSAMTQLEGASSSNTADLLHTTCGTPNYVAPEVLADKGYDGRAADLWSCGVILFVLMAGYLPFDEPHMPQLFRKIMKAEFSYPHWFSEGAKSLLDKLLVPDPAKRLTLEQIRKHAWFKVDYQTNQSKWEKIDRSKIDTEHAIQQAEIVETKAAAPATQSASKIESLNAFDLISQSFNDLSTIFEKRRPEEDVQRYTRFTTSLQPKQMFKRIAEALKGIQCLFKPNEETYKAKIELRSSRGIITVTVQAFSMAPGLFMVEFRRGKGDVLEFHKFYKTIRSRLKDVINDGKSETG